MAEINMIPAINPEISGLFTLSNEDSNDGPSDKIKQVEVNPGPKTAIPTPINRLYSVDILGSRSRNDKEGL